MRYKFSNRTNWELNENNISQIFKQLKLEQVDVLDLTVSNPTKLNFLYPKEKILKALNSSENLLYFPDSKGLLLARKEVVGYYAQKGIILDPEQIFLTASTSEAYSFVFRLLANPKDNVVFPKPSYPLFEFLVGLNDLEMNTYPLIYDNGWHPDWDILRESFSDKTKAVVVVNPNNPTGSFLEGKDVDCLNEMIKEKNMAIVCDEVFLDYMFDETQDYLSLAGNCENLTFVLGGLSKALGMPQMKLSWIVVNGPEDQMREACSKLEVIADTYLSVNAPSQNALKQWFECKCEIQKSICDRICSNYTYLKDRTEDVSLVECLYAQGGWYAVLKVSSMIKEEDIVLNLLEEDHVFVHPGYFFDFPEETFLIVSLLATRESFRVGLERILKRLASY